MQRNFISLKTAEKLTGKSRSTLVRLCNKIEPDGYARKDRAGTWEIEKGYLLQFYGLSEGKAETLQSSANDKGLQSVVQSLLERIKDLTELNSQLSKQNRELLEDNRRLLSAPKLETKEKDYTPVYFAVLVLILIAVVVYLVMGG